MMSFEKMHVSTRLMVAGFAVVVGLALLTANTVIQIRNDTLEAHNTRLKDLIETTVGIVRHYQAQETGKKLSREEAQLQAKEAFARSVSAMTITSSFTILKAAH